MKNFSFIILIFAIFLLVKFLPENIEIQDLSTLLIGVMLLTSYLFAKSIKNFKLPKLTGYMLMGVILGPVGLKFITNEVVDQLAFLENMALAFIALTAGGELRFRELKKYKKSIISILFFQIVFVFAGIIFLFILISNYIPFLASLNNNIIYGFAILFAATALSKSPATTVGVITELNAKGKITELILSITVLKAFLIVLLFPVFITWSKIYLIEGTLFNIRYLINMSIHLFSSILLGIFIGILIIWYIAKIRKEISLFLIGIALIITEMSSLVGVEILLTSIIAGVIVQNFSKQGESLISGIELSSLPIYIIFFCFAGASLHVEVIIKAFYLTIFLVISRLFLIYIGNYIGAAIVGEDNFVKNVSWMGFVGQAGIALGLGVIIEQNFPGAVGKSFLTILIATVVLNEMMGPIMFKYVLVKAKEVKDVEKSN